MLGDYKWTAKRANRVELREHIKRHLEHHLDVETLGWGGRHTLLDSHLLNPTFVEHLDIINAFHQCVGKVIDEEHYRAIMALHRSDMSMHKLARHYRISFNRAVEIIEEAKRRAAEHMIDILCDPVALARVTV